MTTLPTRRRFLHTTAGTAALAGLGDLGFLARLPQVSAAEAKVDTQTVQFGSEIEPAVRLLEDTPREKLLEEVASRIRAGLSYRELLAALLLAGVRNVQPRPSVGHKFHSVLVVNSAHLASLSSPDEHRWLPIFWALDYFKSTQEQDTREGNWTMAALEESAVPEAPKARQAFIEAMDRWDEAAVDPAVAGLARSTGAGEIYELFYRYGARDFRSIGHKAIYVANSWRTLSAIGWQHAEPVLRSLAYALQNAEGDNPARSDHPADRPWRKNVELAKTIRPDWLSNKSDDAAVHDLLVTLRGGSADDVCRQSVELLNRGVSASSIWDALYLGAAELLARQPGIVALHAVTTTNAMGFAFRASGSDETRRMLLLQNAAFLPLFREAMGGRGRIKEFDIEAIQPEPLQASAGGAIDEIFGDVSRDPMLAAGKVLGHLSERAEAKDLIDAARVLVFLKGNNAHDYKFSSAVLEDYYHVSPQWRNRYLACSVFSLRGSGGADNRLVQRTRDALGAG